MAFKFNPTTSSLDLTGGGSGITQLTGDVLAGPGTGSQVASIASNVIVNADINSAAAIDYSKLAALTASRALVSNGSGVVSVSTVTSTELGYLSGVTSSVQTQLNTLSSTISNFEWQPSVLTAGTLTPPGSPSAGQRYLINGVGAGGWVGQDNKIAEYNGSSWVYTNPSTGMFVAADDESDKLYLYGGSSWTAKQFELTTASTGLTKVGYDIRIATGGIIDSYINASAGIDATKIANGSVDNTEFQYLNGVTSAIQTQLNGKIDSIGDAVGSGTSGSILFIDGSGNLAQDNSSFYYDSSIKSQRISMYSDTSTDLPSHTLFKARGTSGSPSNLQNGDKVGSIVFTGRGNGGTTYTGAYIEANLQQAPNAFNPLSLGLDFYTRATTSIKALALAYNGDATFYNNVITGGTVTLNALTATTVPYLNASKELTSSSVTPTELGYLSGVTSAIQTQLNGKIDSIGDSIGGSSPGAVLFVDASSNLSQDISNLLWDTTNNKLRVGASFVSSATKFAVDDSGSLAGNSVGITKTVSSPTGSINALNIVTSATASSSNSNTIYGLRSDVTRGSNMNGLVIGSTFTAKAGSNIASTNDAIAIFALASGTGTGSSTWLKGVSSRTDVSGSNVINQAAGLYVEDASISTGSITNLYGLYIENMSGGTSNTYSIYTGTAQSRFGGKVIIASQNELELQDSTGGDYVRLRANGTTTSHTLTLPATQGSANTYLKNDGSGNLTWSVTGATGDITETSFTALDNQAVAANVTGLAFANGTVRSFVVQMSVVRGSTYRVIRLEGVQRAADWVMSETGTGDSVGLTFTITSAGQVQYTSTSTGDNATLKFRATTTSV